MKRFLYSKIKDHLKKKQITLLLGARQVGKTTLLHQIMAELKKDDGSSHAYEVKYDRKRFRISKYRVFSDAYPTVPLECIDINNCLECTF